MQSGIEIHKLKNEVIDQIAAGEVVERPAHLVKELLENSLDAGATEITLDIEQGGQWIQVMDNGKGIRREDLPLAFARHATSKIDSASDLWQLTSFGFRGEALASIGSVSRTSITSKYKDQNQAYKLDSEFGNLNEITPSGGSNGTTIRVSDLFQNVPARLKFMKSDSAEVNQIKTVTRAIALSEPNLSLRIRLQNKLVSYWPSQDNFLNRTEQVLENSPMYLTEGEFEGFKVKIVYSSPHRTVGTSRNMWFFVRNRWVQDKGLQTAVLEAYRNLLMHGEFPVVALWLDCDPQEVDVNIHPTKSQIKFRDPKIAFRCVHRVLRSALEKAPWLKEFLPTEQTIASPQSANVSTENLQTHFERMNRNIDLKTQTHNPYSENPDFHRTQFLVKNYSISELNEPQKNFGADQPKESYVGLQKWSHLQVIGQANLTYIVTQSQSEIVLVDQHAAHERVAFERLMQNWREGNIEVQNFLIPLVFDLNEDQVKNIISYQDDLTKMGIEIDQVGLEAIAIRSAPTLIKDSALIKLIEKLKSDLDELGESFVFEKHIGDLFATMACHSVVRAGQALSLAEMQSLLNQMDEFPLSSFCPHGRQVFLSFPFAKIERDFGRIV